MERPFALFGTRFVVFLLVFWSSSTPQLPVQIHYNQEQAQLGNEHILYIIVLSMQTV